MEIIGYIQLYMRFEVKGGPRYGKMESDFGKPITEEALQSILEVNVKTLERISGLKVENACFVTKEEYEKETANSTEEISYSWDDTKKE